MSRRAAGSSSQTRRFRDHTPWGHIGELAMALPETGERCYDVIVDWIVSVLARDFSAA